MNTTTRPACGAAWVVLLTALSAPTAGASTRSASLALLSARPVDGSFVPPHQSFVLTFDRALDPSSLSAEAVVLSYVDCPYTFVIDPFLYTARHLEASSGGTALVVDPPDLMPGQTVEITVTGALRGLDGSALAPAGGEPAGRVQRVLRYQVLALPPASLPPP